jgi:hypothetical protein
VLAFSNRDVIRLARENFIAVVGDDWYQRRRKDAEGEFFRKVSTQAGRGSDDPSGGSTRQGIYCLTASGKLLSFKNAGQSPEETRNALRNALVQWRGLPDAERQPGAVHVPDAATDARFVHSPPAGGLILNVYTRLLDHDGQGDLCTSRVRVNGALREAQRDHLWLTEAEWKALIPAQPKAGDRFAVPDAIAKRILRFHLADSTPGEPRAWAAENIQSGSLNMIVDKSDPAKLRLRIEGSVLLASGPLAAAAERGYDAQLLGYLTYDVSRKSVERFDLVALGDCWGKQAICEDKQPRHRLLGVAFELARGDSAADRIPPQAARSLEDYWRAEK